MNLKDRATALQHLGFFDETATLDINEIVARADAGDAIDAKLYPATAILAAAGALLEISTDAAESPEDYEAILMEVAAISGGFFKVSNVRAAMTGEATPDGRPMSLRYNLDSNKYESDLLFDPEQVDVGFMAEIDRHLASKQSHRRFCPIVEIMDDTARYVFADPDSVEQAELDEVIAAPDFEETDF